jgi:branched-chain amino acid transport system ATP-binding protein
MSAAIDLDHSRKSASPAPLLRVDRIEANYGTSQVLFGVSLDVRASEVVTLLGRNSMGKSTVVKVIAGLSRLRSGTIHFAETAAHGYPPHRMARIGLGLVPEGRQIFPTPTVRENLVATANPAGCKAPWTLERVYAMFPRPRERERNLGIHLSGGEQQMLAIGRALMTNPKLLVLDKATEGLAPLIRQDIWRCLSELKRRACH